MLSMPFPGKSIKELYAKITRGKYEKVSGKYSEPLRKLIDDMLSPIPSKRPTSDSIVACAGKTEIYLVLNKVTQPMKKPKKNIINELFTEWQDPEAVNNPARPGKGVNTRDRISSTKRNLPLNVSKEIYESKNYSANKI
jgi:serine/threonine protein kinase